MKETRTPYDALRFHSAFSHGLGFALALVGGIALFLHTLPKGGWYIASCLVYSLSLMGLYGASALYHSLRTSVPWRAFLRKMDHTMIYILIAGSYTPICLTVLREQGVWGWTLFGIIWACALGGIIVKFFWITAPRWLASATYIVMGWMVLIAIYPLTQVMPWKSGFWLVAGGVLYTVGGVLYALRWPLRNAPRFGCHEIFHYFILAGSTCHFICIYGL